MNYEEKYKTALEKAEGIINYYKSRNRNEAAIEDLQEIFPELKESEDEKIKKELIDAVQGLWDNDALPMPLSEKRKDAWIVYLEKQGEKDKLIKELGEYKVKYTQEILSQQLEKQGIKPQGKSALEAIHEQRTDNANKVERKFKVGDYIVNDYCKGKVIELTTDAYLLDTEQGIPFSCEHNAHLWSIQDANDGDVLARNNDILSICIFSHFDGINNKFSSFLCHCGIEGEGLGQELSINGYHDDSKNYVPATKEQRELLFSRMTEAGYVFDFENKQLRKIEQKSDSFCKENCRGFKETGRCFADGSCDAKIKAE